MSSPPCPLPATSRGPPRSSPRPFPLPRSPVRSGRPPRAGPLSFAADGAPHPGEPRSLGSVEGAGPPPTATRTRPLPATLPALSPPPGPALPGLSPRRQWLALPDLTWTSLSADSAPEPLAGVQVSPTHPQRPERVPPHAAAPRHGVRGAQEGGHTGCGRGRGYGGVASGLVQRSG